LLRSIAFGLLIVGVVAIVICVALAVFIWRVQERVVFQPPVPPHVDPRGARRLEFQAEDGQPLFAWLVGNSADSGVIIAFHGNADLAVWQLPWAEELARRTGRAVLVAEFRGYGGLPGTPTYVGVQHDARAVYALAHDTLGVRPDRIVLYGHSLGSAIATELAREVHPAALLLVSPLTSVRAMASRVSPGAVIVFWSGLARVHYDTEALVRALDIPVSVAHGARDDVIPLWMGRRVFEAAKMPRALLVIDDAGHNDVVDRGGERYWAWVREALSS
jgi:fermentation-respiration switch protein FrsA (DUF1100 family)